MIYLNIGGLIHYAILDDCGDVDVWDSISGTELACWQTNIIRKKGQWAESGAGGGGGTPL